MQIWVCKVALPVTVEGLDIAGLLPVICIEPVPEKLYVSGLCINRKFQCLVTRELAMILRCACAQILEIQDRVSNRLLVDD